MKHFSIKIFLCVVLPLFLSSCESGMEEYSWGKEDVYLQLDFVRSEMRANMAGDGSGTFSEGDVIGLYIDNGDEIQYRSLTYTAGQWQPRLKRSEFGTGRLKLSAHYPAISNPDEIDPESYAFQVDQNQMENSASDLLFAQAWLEKDDYRTSLVFKHLMHRLQIDLVGDTEGVEVAVRSLRQGVVNLLTGTTALSSDQFEWITPRKNGDGNYEALVFPQSAEPYREEEGLLKITRESKESRFKAPELNSEGETFAAFESGKETSIHLSIKAGHEDLANRTLWVYGVDAPDFPGKENIPSYPPYVSTFPEGAWFRWDWTFREFQYLTWKEGCGWYDCNKSAEYNENDANLCWAAAASNLLIWWMVQNKDYIEAYDQDYGSTVKSTVDDRVFERPAADFKPLYATDGSVNRAPVFEFFKKSFPNMGSWEVGAINRFITGYQSGNMAAPTYKGFPGFFANVFKRSDQVTVEAKHSPDSEEFNDFMINALLNKQSIGFSAFDIAGSGTGNHALVIWGAEFDESGLISHIYYCDNNNADQDANGAAISRGKIVYLEDSSIPELGTQECTYITQLDNEEGNPSKPYKITSIYSVDMRMDLWEQKYPSVAETKN